MTGFFLFNAIACSADIEYDHTSKNHNYTYHKTGYRPQGVNERKKGESNTTSKEIEYHRKKAKKEKKESCNCPKCSFIHTRIV